MKLLFLFFIFTNATICFAKPTQISAGNWLFNLQISKSHHIAIQAEISDALITLVNGSERITLEPLRTSGDSLIADFPLYNSSLVIKTIKKKKVTGYWRNYQKKGNYAINLTGVKKRPKQKYNTERLKQLNGRWETTIQYGKPTKLIGEFKSHNNTLTGTFRSETGDYRFLSGNVVKDSMYLSCFDGTHCYLFTGKVFSNDSISGRFFSGNHYRTTWTAIKNPSAHLRSPDSLTYIKNNQQLSLSLPTINHTNYEINSATINKPTIIQIFGSWCPNCVDETRFLNELNTIYGNKIQIIGIGFEMGDTDTEKLKYLTTFTERLHINYPILLGGSANKAEAAALFPMLNHIMSFPTLLVVNSHGEIVKIHTGFNGPATGNYYTSFTNEMKVLLDDLLMVN
ncbi:MAG: TlpA disulfide reductase family protein [Putridiphycobacter sp.]|nr:TlpA disulfide reductase family protein [Putridiphycobacter sp.]